MHKAIRFVGGPWHNRVEWVELAPKVAITCKDRPQQMALYHLAEYTTKHGTSYYQYIHGSLIKNQKAHTCTYRERFRQWRLDRQQLEARLRRAMNAQRH